MSHLLQPIVEDLLREIHRMGKEIDDAITRNDEAYALLDAERKGVRKALNILLNHKNTLEPISTTETRACEARFRLDKVVHMCQSGKDHSRWHADNIIAWNNAGKWERRVR
jgi:ribosomal protein L17